MEAYNKDSIVRRIEEFRTYCGISKSTLAASIGIEQTTLNNQLIGKRGLSLDTVSAMLQAFSELSAEWLLRDRGDMLISKFDGSPKAERLKQAERIERLIGTIETLQESIDLKNKSINIYKEENAILKDRIAHLENQLKTK